MAGQSINDRLTAARYSIAGQGLARSVCKATTEEIMGPKKKHLEYLLHCTNEPNVSIPQLANLLIERTTNTSWVVVFKALITVHHLMCYGNERFTQFLASSNSSFQLSNYLDKNGYEMSTSIRRYSKYLNEKALSYRTVAFDFCKVKRGKEDGLLRTMDADKLLKTVPALQSQIDNLLDFDCSSNELTNGVISSCFLLLFRDLIRLFACYNDGIINLLEKYFDMNKKNCRDALDLYKKFLIRMDRVAEFLKVAESAGIDKGDIPDLAKAPSSLLDALEAHLENLEGKKSSNSSSHFVSLKSAVTAFSNTSSAFGSAGGGTAGSTLNSSSSVNGVKTEDNLKKMALEEEKAVLEQHKKDLQQAVDINEELVSTERRLKELQVNQSKSTNPFLSSPIAEPSNIPPLTQHIDLLDAGSPTVTVTESKASDDLLCLSGNPFAESVLNAQKQQPTTKPTGMPWSTNGFAGASSTTTSSNEAFLNDNAFVAAFGDTSTTTTTTGFDAFGDILMPQSGVGMAATKSSPSTVIKTTVPMQSAPKVMTGDLDSSLASLVQNLDMNDPRSKTNRQWNNSPKNTTKTGGANWSAATGNMPAATGPVGGWPSQPNPYMGGQPRPMAPGMMMSGMPGQMPGQMPAQPGGMYYQGMAGAPRSGNPAANPSQNKNTSDPFGNL